MHTIEEQPIIVRQRLLVFFVFLAGGALFTIFPWTLDLQAPLWMRLFWTTLGVVAVSTGAFGIRYARIALAIDRKGVWLLGWSLPPRFVLVPWDELEGAQVVRWTDRERNHEGLALGLGAKALANITGSRVIGSPHQEEMKAHLGPVLWEHAFFLERPDWDCTPTSLAAAIELCLREPSSRLLLGSFDMPR